jgi:DNA-binding transcriptional ArsR family regulator
MHLTDAKRRILRVLRQQSTTPYNLAAQTGLPQFTIRAELADLRADRIVAAVLCDREVLWELTTYGAGVAWTADQMELA